MYSNLGTDKAQTRRSKQV